MSGANVATSGGEHLIQHRLSKLDAARQPIADWLDESLREQEIQRDRELAEDQARQALLNPDPRPEYLEHFRRRLRAFDAVDPELYHAMEARVKRLLNARRRSRILAASTVAGIILAIAGVVGWILYDQNERKKDNQINVALSSTIEQIRIKNRSRSNQTRIDPVALDVAKRQLADAQTAGRRVTPILLNRVNDYVAELTRRKRDFAAKLDQIRSDIELGRTITNADFDELDRQANNDMDDKQVSEVRRANETRLAMQTAKADAELQEFVDGRLKSNPQVSLAEYERLSTAFNALEANQSSSDQSAKRIAIRSRAKAALSQLQFAAEMNQLVQGSTSVGEVIDRVNQLRDRLSRSDLARQVEPLSRAASTLAACDRWFELCEKFGQFSTANLDELRTLHQTLAEFNESKRPDTLVAPGVAMRRLVGRAIEEADPTANPCKRLAEAFADQRLTANKVVPTKSGMYYVKDGSFVRPSKNNISEEVRFKRVGKVGQFVDVTLKNAQLLDPKMQTPIDSPQTELIKRLREMNSKRTVSNALAMSTMLSEAVVNDRGTDPLIRMHLLKQILSVTTPSGRFGEERDLITKIQNFDLDSLDWMNPDDADARIARAGAQLQLSDKSAELLQRVLQRVAGEDERALMPVLFKCVGFGTYFRHAPNVIHWANGPTQDGRVLAVSVQANQVVLRDIGQVTERVLKLNDDAAYLDDGAFVFAVRPVRQTEK